MTPNTNIMITIIAGLTLIGYLFYVAPSEAPAQAPAVLLAIGVLVKLFNTDGKVDKGIEVSHVNSEKIDDVHAIVNSQRTAMEQKITALQAAIVSLREERAATIVEVAHARGSEQRIISAIEAVVTPPGGTPPHGTPIQPGDHS